MKPSAATREPLYCVDAAALRVWFARHASTEAELVVGFMKVGSGHPSITWPEAVDEALCVGWIDGVRHRIDKHRYRIRFTPRKAGSHWSAVNIARIAVLQAEGRMQPAGLAAFAKRTEARSRQASYEQPSTPTLAPDELRRFRRLPAAWAFYQAAPAAWRRTVTWWVVKAKRPETRIGRLEKLIDACARGVRL